jgi:outer membrane lipoprotein carrier protein
MRAFLLALALGLALPHAIASESGVDALLAALAPVKHLQGSFTQRHYGQDEQLLAESSGRFRLLRPGYFSWEIQSPDSQLIVADPEFVWHHDRDLETVTRRPASQDGEGAPFQILGGDAADLRERFTVQQLEPGAFLVSPLSGAAGFKELTLTLEASRLSRMAIRDNLDQEILIEFSDLDSEAELTPADFAFTPPAGADTFYYDQ